MYYDKWWKSQGRESEETACLSSKSSSQETVANALGVVNIGGIFVVLARIHPVLESIFRSFRTTSPSSYSNLPP